jgi:ketosteroid isomerase-like protein
MLSETDARQFADDWIRAWNSHDLDAIMSHYAAEVVLTSPTAAKLLTDSSGTIKGKEAVRNYFEKGLDTFPNLNFEHPGCDVGNLQRCTLLPQSEGL